MAHVQQNLNKLIKRESNIFRRKASDVAIKRKLRHPESMKNMVRKTAIIPIEQT